VLAQTIDITRPGQLETFVEAAASRWQRLDIVVHNTGGARGTAALSTPDPEFTAAFELNAGVALRAARAAEPWMRKTGYGRMIFIASVYGREAGGRAAYNVAKSAEISLAKALARELAPSGILVNAVAPGSLMFPGSSWERRRQADPAAIDACVRAELPLGRFGTPEEVANVVVFLASERASLVSGSCWTVDGGQSRSLI
jgi:3-oxoacyl-[acyl-carrier protein] reductase